MCRTAAMPAHHSLGSINMTERVSGHTLTRELSTKMRALFFLFFVWTSGDCLPVPNDMQRQETINPATLIQVDNCVQVLHEATPEADQRQRLREDNNEIPVRATRHLRASNMDTDSKKVTVKVPCRRTTNNPCLGSEIYEFVLLNSEGLVT